MLNPIPSTNSRTEYLFRFFESMSEKELRQELRKISLNQSGSRKQMIKRLRDYYRNELIENRRKNHHNFFTENIYDYLIERADREIDIWDHILKDLIRDVLNKNFLLAIDFECTCELGEYEYDHEIIEFPAVLISVRGKKIIDTFRTVIRPKSNPTLTKYCTQLTGITQKMVNEASNFPDALYMFRAWMSKHGLDGLNHKGGNCRRFCYVTDGPWDIAKFLQADCIRWGMPIPHDFRSFLNLRRAFVNFYCHARPGNPNPTRLPSADLQQMLKRLGMQFEGIEHCGMDDAFNVARIVVRMLNDHAELRVNEKLVNAACLLPWHRKQLIFTDEMWQRQQQQNEGNMMPPKSISHSQSSSAEDIICAGMARVGIWDEVCTERECENGIITRHDKLVTELENGINNSNFVMGNGGGKHGKGLYKWWDALPYKLVRITREQFISELFLECESCDEEDEQE